MNLLITKLTGEQAQIVYFFEVFNTVAPIVDPRKKLEITDDGAGDYAEFTVDWLTLFKDNDEVWVAGSVECVFGGSYFEPPDYDFIEIAVQEPKQSIESFVRAVVRKILDDQFDIALECAAESVLDYQLAQAAKYEEIPF